MYKKCEEILNKLESEGKIKRSDFSFPPKQELKLKLKDMLEDEVDEKYYLVDNYLEFTNFYTIPRGSDGELINGSYNRVWKKDKYVGALNLTKITEIGDILQEDLIKGDGANTSSMMEYQRGNVQKESIQTLTTSGGNDRAVVLKSKCKRLESLVEKTDFEEGKVLNMDLYNQTTNENISQCLTTPNHNSQRLFDGLRIRKLTPKEYWRLMGFDDSDYEKAAKVNSNTQLYKQAGNSIVVNVLMAIFKELIK